MFLKAQLIHSLDTVMEKIIETESFAQLFQTQQFRGCLPFLFYF